MKKLFCLTLALLLLTPALIACDIDDFLEDPDRIYDSAADYLESGRVNREDLEDAIGDVISKHPETTDGRYPNEEHSTTDTDVEGGLPEEPNYKGVEVVIAVREESRFCREFDAEQQTTPIDAAVYQRNKRVENMLNINLRVDTSCSDKLRWTSNGEYVNFVLTQFASGIVSYDILVPSAEVATPLSLFGVLQNFHAEEMAYLELSDSHWNQSYIEAATVRGQLYGLVGSTNLSVYDRSNALFVNTTLLEQTMKLNRDDLYQLVKNGSWTMEQYLTMLRSFTLNDPDFQSSDGNYAYDSFLAAFDLSLLEKGTYDELLAFSIEDNQKLQNAKELLDTLYGCQTAWITVLNNGTPMDYFAEGSSVFHIDMLNRNETAGNTLRDSEIDYTILPLPKYDPQQESYYTAPAGSYSVLTVIDQAPEDLKRISVVLKLLDDHSARDVLPQYVESLGYANDQQTRQLVELLMDSVRFDSAMVYDSSLNNVVNRIWRTAIIQGEPILTNWYIHGEQLEVILTELNTAFLMEQDT